MDVKIIQFFQEEWDVISQRPRTFARTVILTGLIAAVVFTWYFWGRIDTLKEHVSTLEEQIKTLKEESHAKDDEISRYRNTLGIDPASKGSLVELTNQELASKALMLVSKMRQLSSNFDQQSMATRKQQEDGKITKIQEDRAQSALMRDFSKEFDDNFSSDANNVRKELRRRLDPRALSGIVKAPSWNTSDGGNVTITALFAGSGFNSFFMGILATEIEQMAKLLPPDSPKQ